MCSTANANGHSWNQNSELKNHNFKTYEVRFLPSLIPPFSSPSAPTNPPPHPQSEPNGNNYELPIIFRLKLMRFNANSQGNVSFCISFAKNRRKSMLEMIFKISVDRRLKCQTPRFRFCIRFPRSNIRRLFTQMIVAKGFRNAWIKKSTAAEVIERRYQSLKNKNKTSVQLNFINSFRKIFNFSYFLSLFCSKGKEKKTIMSNFCMSPKKFVKNCSKNTKENTKFYLIKFNLINLNLN